MNVWSTPETRNDLDAIRGLLIDTPEGGHVRLEDVADVNIVPTPNMIKREHMMRKIDVGAKVRGRDLGWLLADVKQALAKVEFPAGTTRSCSESLRSGRRRRSRYRDWL